ncbi:MAG: hypothetical protein SGCHY_003795 [Lobulomycetales sp.]
MRVFVTVGSTRFDALVDSLTSSEALDRLSAYGHLVVQTGASPCRHRDVQDNTKITFSNYAYKASLEPDIDAADLIISHAGSGSILEALSAHKRLVVVVNQSLMDNHQAQLADKLAQMGCLVKCVLGDAERVDANCATGDEKVDANGAAGDERVDANGAAGDSIELFKAIEQAIAPNFRPVELPERNVDVFHAALRNHLFA